MTKKIFSSLICFWFLTSCNNKISTENGVPESNIEVQSDTLYEKVAKEIKTMFGAETCKITRDQDVVTIKSLFTEQSFKEQDASVIALVFYQLSLTNKLKPYNTIRIAFKDNYSTTYDFGSGDFKERSECFEAIKNIGLLLSEGKYPELKKYIDPSQSDAEADRAIKLFRKADSISGKINSFAIISIQFGAITRINAKGDRLSNPSTYYSFGFNNKTNKLQYIDVNESSQGLFFYK